MPKIRQDIIIMNVTQYSVTDKETGEINEGTTVRYAMTGVLSPCEEEQLKGYKLAKASFDSKKFDEFKVVPGVYAADLNYNIKSDGTMTVKADNFEFKSALVPAEKK